MQYLLLLLKKHHNKSVVLIQCIFTFLKKDRVFWHFVRCFTFGPTYYVHNIHIIYYVHNIHITHNVYNIHITSYVHNIHITYYGYYLYTIIFNSVLTTSLLLVNFSSSKASIAIHLIGRGRVLSSTR